VWPAIRPADKLCGCIPCQSRYKNNSDCYTLPLPAPHGASPLRQGIHRTLFCYHPPLQPDMSRPFSRIRHWFRQPGRLALFLLIVATLASAAHWNGLSAPHHPSAGNRIFPDGRDNLSFSDKYLEPLKVFANIGDDVAAIRETIRVFEWVQIGLWYGSLGFTLLLLFLVLTWRWWSPLTQLPAENQTDDKPKARWRDGFRARWWSVAVLLLALGIAAGTRLPVLDRPILWDEQDNLRTNFHGYYDYKSVDEDPIWQEATMLDAMWMNARGNNPHLLSVLSQVSNQIWRRANDVPRDRFSPTALRLPVALAALLGIAALWWMINLMGWRIAAPLAALLAALHPLHAEYSIQARGHGFMLLFVPLALGAITLAWHRRWWRDFWLFGICLFLGLLAFPGSIYFATCVSIAAVGAFLWQWLVNKDIGARAAICRCILCGILLAGILAWLLAPTFPQLSTWLVEGFQKGHMPSWWYLAAYLMFATGLSFMFPGEYFRMPAWTSPSSSAWIFGPFFTKAPLLALWSIILFPLFVALGMAALWQRRDSRFPFLVLTATIASAFLCLAHHAFITSNYIYGWYTLFALPALLTAIAMGWERIAHWLQSRWRFGTHASVVFASAMLILFASLTHPALQRNPYDFDDTSVTRRPRDNSWAQPSPEEIGRTLRLRGNSMWVVYQDGLHVVYRDYREQQEAVDALIPRTAE